MKEPRFVVPAFFAVFFAIGLGLFSDYGISWDEPMHRNQGRRVVQYITDGDTRAFRHPMRYHGPFLDVVLEVTERVLRLDDPRDVYLVRHFITFTTFFLGVFFFYRLVALLFGSWQMGLLGALLLILSPRQFAHGFYNMKDIPAMSFFIVSMYTMIRWLDRGGKKWAASHALAGAVLVSLRVTGVLIPFLTTLFVAAKLWKERHAAEERRRLLSELALYAGLATGLTVLFWPALWRNPPLHFVQAIELMSQYSWKGKVLYWGERIRGTAMPWHYVPVWILISTPLSYLVLAGAGLVASVGSLFRPGPRWPDRRHVLLLLSWLFLPLSAVTVAGSVVYDGWRHTFFVYPSLLVFALVGIRALFTTTTTLRKRLAVVAAILLAADLAGTAWFMVRHHPYQNVYFNQLIGGVRGAAGRFELDYWGLSYRAALEYLVRENPRGEIRVRAANQPGKSNAIMLHRRDRERVRFVAREEAEYFMTNFRDLEIPFGREVFAVRVDGVPIVAVFKR